MMAAEAWTDWHTSVCDCFEDASTCKDGRGCLLRLTGACTCATLLFVCFCRLLRLLVLPLPGVHGFIQVRGERLPPGV